MARARETKNGRLEDALTSLVQSRAALNQAQATLSLAHATLVQTQASLVQNQAAFVALIAEMKADADRRFSRIEAILLEHSRILQHHSEVLERLPDAVRDKIGFMAAGQQS
jgi:hypothetical protein